MRRTGRKSMIGGLIALSMILTGTGYAYWTDSLNVTTKATTGDLAVTFVDLGLYAQYNNETEPNGWSIVDGIGESGYVNDDFFMRGKTNYNIVAREGSIQEYRDRANGYNNVTFGAELVDPDWIPKSIGGVYTTANTKGSNEIELNIQQMYPGNGQAFRTDILNVGDIAAKLTNIRFDVKDYEEMETGNVKDMLGIAILINKEIYNPSNHAEKNAEVFKLCQSLALNADDYFTVGGVDFLRLSVLENLDPAAVRDAITNGNVYCDPADCRMDLFMAVAMDPDEEGRYTTGKAELLLEDIADRKNDEDTEQKGVTVLMNLLWDQFNMGKTVENPNILKNQNVQ